MSEAGKGLVNWVQDVVKYWYCKWCKLAEVYCETSYRRMVWKELNHSSIWRGGMHEVLRSGYAGGIEWNRVKTPTSKV